MGYINSFIIATDEMQLITYLDIEFMPHLVIVITTDGQENASQEYSAKMVKKMIEQSHNSN